ncbi:MAG TPA: HlyD family efflux transporter periplasmic adaptor subunit [Phycisphaerae bacterium]|nr:HlyD family efflux transporter periplasmic adaptor subunit [Phycisphaerae bacterium]
MRLFRRGPFSTAAILLILATASGCPKQETTPPQPAPRPVTVLELRRIDPAEKLRLTGSVESWKEQNVAFEIGGRVDWVVDQGQDVKGRLTNPDGDIVTQGTVLARLDPTRYELAVATAEADVANVAARIAEVQIELDQVLPHKLAAAEAQRDRAHNDLERLKRLVRQEAGSATEYYREEAAYQVAQATVQEVEAAVAAKHAEVQALKAREDQASEHTRQARNDLEYCTLICPLDGRVAEVHVIPGTYVQPGQPVARVVMMDPLKVSVVVPAETARTLNLKDTVYVCPPDGGEPRPAPVWLKDTVAGSVTPVSRIGILLRNQKVRPAGPDDPALPDLPFVQEIWPITLLDVGHPDGALGTEVSAICTDPAEGYHYVWHIEDSQDRPAPPPEGAVLRLRKVRVEVGERVLRAPGLFRLQELTDTGGLGPTANVAAGVPDTVADGDRALFAPERWLFRPGDPLEVSLKRPGADTGFYVPIQAVLPVNETTGHVYIVEDGLAARVDVGLTTRIGDLQGIKAAAATDEQRITDGTPVILKEVQYLISGELVRVVQTEDLQP